MLRIAAFLATFFVSAVVLANGPMKCYQCNSAVDENCDSSDEGELSGYIKTCHKVVGGTYDKKDATGCRKIVQSVESTRTIIRECAHSGPNDMDGMRKQGNKGVKMLYYQCENTDNSKPCNGAPSVVSSALLAVVSVVAVLTRL